MTANKISWRESASDDALKTLRAPDSCNIIFGSGEIGKLLLDACEKLGIHIAAFCDNSQARIGDSYGNIPIIRPEEAFRLSPHSNFLLALYTVQNLASSLAQLAEMGALNIYNAELFGRLYGTGGKFDGSNENLDSWLLAIKVERCHKAYGKEPGGLIITDLGCYITNVCSLNCRDCGSFMPYFKNPGHLPLVEVTQGIDAICKTADHIVMLEIIGGEPLCHPDFHLIVRHAASQPNIDLVAIITNGTMIPREDQWADLRNEKVVFQISDYGKLSRNLHDLRRQLDNHGIKGMVTQMSEWLEWRKIGKAGRSPEELKEYFQSCRFNKCFMLGGARLYRCGSIVAGTRAGIIPDCSANYIDVEPKAEAIRQNIQDYLYGRDVIIPACDYCPGGIRNGPTVKPAEQVCKMR